MSDTQFEQLLVCLCQNLLGVSVQGFSQGPDGGRDAKFVGTAEIHPSKASPWVGTTIIQAKHSNGYNRSFSESDFFSVSSEHTIVGKEIPRIKKLRKNNQLDNYMLFANRKLSGGSESVIRAQIAKSCDIPEESIYLCGLEQLETWIKRFPEVAKLADLDPIDSPLIVSPDELADVVEALSLQKENFSDVPDVPPTPRVPYKNKNKFNNMSDEYAKNIRKRYLKETSQIKAFLSSPENVKLLRMYESVVDEFQIKIISKRKNYQEFDSVMEYLLELLFNRDPILSKNKKLTRTLLFYMYWNCDIGLEENA